MTCHDISVFPNFQIVCPSLITSKKLFLIPFMSWDVLDGETVNVTISDLFVHAHIRSDIKIDTIRWTSTGDPVSCWITSVRNDNFHVSNSVILIDTCSICIEALTFFFLNLICYASSKSASVHLHYNLRHDHRDDVIIQVKILHLIKLILLSTVTTWECIVKCVSAEIIDFSLLSHDVQYRSSQIQDLSSLVLTSCCSWLSHKYLNKYQTPHFLIWWMSSLDNVNERTKMIDTICYVVLEISRIEDLTHFYIVWLESIVKWAMGIFVCSDK